MNFDVGVHDEEFLSWLNRVEHSFVYMIETMKDVARVVGENTQPITPFETGKLSRSFKWHILTDNSRMKVIQLQMSALNERTGYDYAWIQHENPLYHHTQGDMWFLKEGIQSSEGDAMVLIEEDYLSLFERGYIF